MIKLTGSLAVKRLHSRVQITTGAATGTGSLQEKTVAPTLTAQVVTPDGGYAGLSRVNVEAVALQDKTVAPSTGGQTVKADDGSLGLGTVIVQGAPLQHKTVTPAAEVQTVTPDSGYYGLAEVTVTVDENLTPANIREGVTIYGVAGTWQDVIYVDTVDDLPLEAEEGLIAVVGG